MATHRFGKVLNALNFSKNVKQATVNLSKMKVGSDKLFNIVGGKNVLNETMFNTVYNSDIKTSLKSAISSAGTIVDKNSVDKLSGLTLPQSNSMQNDIIRLVKTLMLMDKASSNGVNLTGDGVNSFLNYKEGTLAIQPTGYIEPPELLGLQHLENVASDDVIKELIKNILKNAPAGSADMLVGNNVLNIPFSINMLLNSYSGNTPIMRQLSVPLNLNLAVNDDSSLISGNAYWALKIGGNAVPSNTFGWLNSLSDVSITQDDQENIYVTAKYLANVDIYSANTTDKSATISAAGMIANTGDIFIIKYDKDGVYKWYVMIRNTSVEEFPKITFKNGFIYIAGISNQNGQNLTIGSTDGVSITRNIGTGSRNLFIAKYNQDGVVQWVSSVSGYLEISGDIAFDANNNIYVVVHTYGTFSVYDSSGVLCMTSTGTPVGYDFGLVKFNSSGKFPWGRMIIGPKHEWEPCIAAATVAGNTYIYVSGRVGGTNGVETTITAKGNSNNTNTNDKFLLYTTSAVEQSMMIVCYNGDGTPQWITGLNGQCRPSIPSMTTDVSGNVYICLRYGDVLTPGSLLYIFSVNNIVNNRLPSTNTTNIASVGSYDSDLVFIKYNTSGNVQWVTKLRGIYEENRPIITSNASCLIIAGMAQVEIGAYSVGNMTTPSHYINLDYSTDIFIAKYSFDGISQWLTKVTSFHPTTPLYSYDHSPDVTCNEKSIHVAGHYTNTYEVRAYSIVGISPAYISIPKPMIESGHAGSNIFVVKYGV